MADLTPALIDAVQTINAHPYIIANGLRACYDSHRVDGMAIVIRCDLGMYWGASLLSVAEVIVDRDYWIEMFDRLAQPI